MNKSLLVLALAVVVVVSGCAQAAIVTDSFKKFNALESGQGYTADYEIKFGIVLNDKFKQAVASDPEAAASVGQLDKLSDIRVKLSGGKKGDKEKSYLDISGLSALLPSAGPLPFKSLSFYQDKADATVCLETSVIKCTKATKEEIAKKYPNLAGSLNSANQFSQQDPAKLLQQFKVLYDKGALKLGPQGTGSVIGRGCDKISYTVGDLSKLSSKELLAALGPLGSQLEGSQQINPQDLEQLSFLFQKMIKEIKQEFCLDKEHGLPLSSAYSIEIDISQFIKAIAGAFADAQTQKIPEGAGFFIKFDSTATAFKTPAEDIDFTVPPGAKMVSIEELSAAATPAGELFGQ